jgi:hypothetical protein
MLAHGEVVNATVFAIIKAILAGEHDPHKLAELRDPRVKASEEQVERSLADRAIRVGIYGICWRSFKLSRLLSVNTWSEKKRADPEPHHLEMEKAQKHFKFLTEGRVNSKLKF